MLTGRSIEASHGQSDHAPNGDVSKLIDPPCLMLTPTVVRFIDQWQSTTIQFLIEHRCDFIVSSSSGLPRKVDFDDVTSMLRVGHRRMIPEEIDLVSIECSRSASLDMW